MNAKTIAEFHNYIVSHKNEMNEKNAVNILINCCNICVKDSDDNFSEEYLKKILDIAYSLISNLNLQQLLNYIRSVYHIVNYLLKKNCYDSIIGMERIIWPVFLPPELPAQITKIYYNMSILMTNAIINCVKTPNSKLSKENVLKISEISRKLCSKSTDTLTYLKLSSDSFINLTKLNILPQDQAAHFKYILKQIEEQELQHNIAELYEPLSTIIALLIHGTLKQSNFEAIECVIKDIGQFLFDIFDNNKHIVNLFEILKLPLLFSFVHTNKDIENVLKYNQALKDFLSSDFKHCRKELSTRLRGILITIANFYRNDDEKRWLTFSKDYQLELFECVSKIGELEGLTPITCSCGCAVKLNYIHYVSFSYIIRSLLEVLFINDSILENGFHEKVVSILIKFRDNIIALQENNCIQWKAAWNTFGKELYSLAVLLYRKEDAVASKYFCLFLQCFIRFQSNEDTVEMLQLLTSSLQGMCSLSLRDPKKCLAFCALGTFLCPEQKHYFMSLWIKTKHCLRGKDEFVRTVTIVQAFKIFAEELSDVVHSKEILNEDDEKQLLIYELEEYKRKWKSKQPMLQVMKELANLITDVQVITQIITKNFSDMELLFHDDILELGKSLLQKIEKFKNSKIKSSGIHLSVLYFLKYKYCLKKKIQKQADELEKTLKKIPVKPNSDIHQDPNEECDMISLCENMKFDKYLEIHKYLEASLNLIHQHSKDIANTGDNFSIYNILLKIASEYKLMNHKFGTIRAVYLALNIAQSQNLTLDIIESASFLIENSDVTKSYCKRLIATTDELVTSLSENQLNSKLKLIYYICKAKAFLNEDPQESYSNYMIARNLLNADPSEENFKIAKKHLLYIMLKYFSLPCDSIPNLHKENYFEVFSEIPSISQECLYSYDNSYDLATFFDLNEEIVKLYHNMKCPREVRYYCREMATITQKLMLPLRYVAYLMYLGQADLYSQRFDDCSVKLTDAADILCFTKSHKQIRSPSPFDKELEIVTTQLGDIQLDVPRNILQQGQSPSSPVLDRTEYYLPKFVKHLDMCECFYCTCFEYQCLVLKRVRLEAALYFKRKDFLAAKDLYCSGMGLYQLYCKKIDDYNKVIGSKVPQDLVPDVKTKFVEPYAQILIDFTKYLVNVNKIDTATEFNEKLYTLLEPLKLKYLHLYHECLRQKIAFLIGIDTPKIEVELETTDPGDSENDVKTPEGHHNVVTVTEQTMLSPCSPIAKLTLKKRLKFDETSPEGYSNEEPEDNNLVFKEKKPTAGLRDPSKTNKGATSKIRQGPSKTPLPKIKIYTEDEDLSNAAVNTRVTRGKTTIEKNGTKTDPKFKEKPQSKREVESSKKKKSTRKNLLGELDI